LAQALKLARGEVFSVLVDAALHRVKDLLVSGPAHQAGMKACHSVHIADMACLAGLLQTE